MGRRLNLFDLLSSKDDFDLEVAAAFEFTRQFGKINKIDMARAEHMHARVADELTRSEWNV